MNDLKFTTAQDYMRPSRFDDLMYHAGLTAQGCWDEMDDYDRKAIEKFAQLIVQECATVIEQNLFQGIGWNTSRAVKRHFGIGEEE
jgi:hypothetical protein